MPKPIITVAAAVLWNNIFMQLKGIGVNMIALGSDHAGFPLKQEIMKHFDEIGVEYKDYGCYSPERFDGISMAANKVKGIRAAACSDYFSAKYTRLHNDANCLCLGDRVVGAGLALELVDVFINTGFEGGRHATRVGQKIKLWILKPAKSFIKL